MEQDYDEYMRGLSPIIVDIETCGHPNAADFLEPVTPDARLKDPEKIKADIADKEASRLAKLALDWNVGRVVALGWWTEDAGLISHVCEDEAHEKAIIGAFWTHARHRTLVGFNLKGFDLRFLVQRSRLLGIPHPVLDFGKYSRKGVEDLYLLLTFGDGTYDQGAMRRTLKAFAKRFGIPVDDAVTGKDVPALVEAGEWEAVRRHVESDVMLTVALGIKIGLLQPAMVA